MKKSLFGLIVLFIFLTTYTPKKNNLKSFNLNIKEIVIENNAVIEKEEIKKKLSFLYEENLFLINTEDITKRLENETFIESFRIKKVYPNLIKLIITEKKPIAILRNKKKKFYISDKGSLIKFKKINKYKELPTVFGKGDDFYTLYRVIQEIKFPFENIKSFYFFESGRWDVIMKDEKIIKLPIKDYVFSLENFMISASNKEFKKYKIFDYRIQNQLILN